MAKTRTTATIHAKIRLGNGGWYWILVAANGRTLAHSEIYSSHAKALQTFNKVSDAFCDKKVILQDKAAN